MYGRRNRVVCLVDSSLGAMAVSVHQVIAEDILRKTAELEFGRFLPQLDMHSMA